MATKTKWTRAHERKRERIIELLERDAQPFADMSEGAQAARRALPLLQWCAMYLPHYFDAPFAPLHRAMVVAAGEPGMPTFIGAFRGAGKSVLLALARPLRRALEGAAPYFLYGARVQKLAAQNMDYVRLELDHNARIRGDYGDLRSDGDEVEWTVDLGRKRRHALTPTLSQGERGNRPRRERGNRYCKFEAFGIGMSPRGRRYRQYRPLEFLGDDLEDSELARNPQREHNLWGWLTDDVLPALEPERYVFTALGTMFGPGCLLQRAEAEAARTDPAGRPLARYISLPALTAAGRSAWPERFTDAALARLRAQVGLRNWRRNYTLDAEDPDKPFQARWFGEYEPGDLDLGALDIVGFLDPALSESPRGCPRALVVVGADRRSGVRYVLDAWIERGSPRQMIEQIFRAHESWRPRVIGIEQNGGYALLRLPLDEEMARRGWIPLRYVTHTRAKEMRIESLCAAVEQGRWLWPCNPGIGVKVLQRQFLAYPDGFVDGPDATAGCDELLPNVYRPRRPAEHRSMGKRRQLVGVL